MKFWGGIFCLGAGLNIILGWHGWPAVLGGSLNDPDSYMRLLRIDQGIAQGHLVNVVARDESGAGTMVEWSRLLDILLWVMAAPLAVFIGWHKALFAAGVALGPLGVGALGVALAFAARPFSERYAVMGGGRGGGGAAGVAKFRAPRRGALPYPAAGVDRAVPRLRHPRLARQQWVGVFRRRQRRFRDLADAGNDAIHSDGLCTAALALAAAGPGVRRGGGRLRRRVFRCDRLRLRG